MGRKGFSSRKSNHVEARKFINLHSYQKELIRPLVTTHRKHEKYVGRMIRGTGEYYRCIELRLPEQLKIEKGQRKTQAQPHGRPRFAGTEVGAADSAE